MTTTDLSPVLDQLAQTYVALHTRKEDLFWRSKMGLDSDVQRTQQELASAEIELNRFLQAPETLARLRNLEKAAPGATEQVRTLRGWIDMFSAHVVEDPKGRKLSEEIVEREQALELARSKMKLGYVDPTSGEFVAASSVKLALLMRTATDERVRRAAFEGLRSIETFVLANGFLDIVKKRNELGRLLGYEDYYDWRVSVVERMRKKRLFEVLDDLARRTATRATSELGKFGEKHGHGSLEPWNFLFLRAGAITRELDPYFGFADSMRRWGRSFAALGVKYRGATLTLDLVDRTGKYENGFMHGPGIAFFDHGAWKPARINFTANAIPGQIGSGLRATETLFHEGGHAAHFANVISNAPCFGQEFAPTSVAYAETQSMFCDSIVSDAEWRVRYALDRAGKPMPKELVEAAIVEMQPFRGWDVRSMLVVPFAERAMYEIADAELTPDRVVDAIRRVETDVLGLPSAPRPVLAVPHLLSGESSAYYHGYVLAEMAVQQTRAFFYERDGHLVDNPRIGPDLAKHYWACGNALSFDETLQSLTGSALSADAIVEACNATVDAALATARTRMERAERVPRFSGPVELDATIRVCHGNETVASTEHGGFDRACDAFEQWIRSLEG